MASLYLANSSKVAPIAIWEALDTLDGSVMSSKKALTATLIASATQPFITVKPPEASSTYHHSD